MANDPAWVPPLLKDQEDRFKPDYPFYEHGAVASWLVRDSAARPVGRISAIHNRAHNEFQQDRTGFFGFFDTVDNPAVAGMLLDEAAKWLRARGLASMQGPMNFSTNEECGMLIEGFDTPPAIMMMHNPPYYNRLMEHCGMSKVMDLLAYELHEGELSPRIVQLANKLEQRLALRVRPFNKRDFWGEVKRFEALYNQIWERNWGFVPMTPAEVKFMAKTLKLVYDSRLIYFAENERGEPVGFILGLPDVNVLFKKMNGRLFPTGIFTLLFGRRHIHRARILTMGVLPEYRNRGLDALLYCRAYQFGTQAGYGWGEFSWMLEDNKPINDAAVAMGSRLYKRWRIWDRPT
ncbi:N-acetyltransferase [candidate division KSB1 bacterium]|nr:N-acetyltransferase [candidate division KSB1 bacterium]